MNSRAYKSPLRERQAAETRARIVQAVVDLLIEEHPATLSMPRIAERADVSVGTVYHHFGSKEDLLDAVSETTDAAVADGLPEHWVHLDQLEEDLCAFWRSIDEQQAFFRAREASPVGRELRRRRVPSRKRQARRLLAPMADRLGPEAVERLTPLMNALVSSGALFRMQEFGLSTDDASRLAAFAVRAVLEKAEREGVP